MLPAKFCAVTLTTIKHALILSTSLLVLSGCSKINQENYDKLKMGMSLPEVETHIGNHSECSSALGAQSCLWGSEDSRYIKVRFVAGAAVTFESENL